MCLSIDVIIVLMKDWIMALLSIPFCLIRFVFYYFSPWLINRPPCLMSIIFIIPNHEFKIIRLLKLFQLPRFGKRIEMLIELEIIGWNLVRWINILDCLLCVLQIILKMLLWFTFKLNGLLLTSFFFFKWWYFNLLVFVKQFLHLFYFK